MKAFPPIIRFALATFIVSIPRLGIAAPSQRSLSLGDDGIHCLSLGQSRHSGSLLLRRRLMRFD